jgi:flagellar hook assembly protein FlgD
MPNGKGVDDILSIRIKAPPSCRVKIKIFAFNGKLLKTFTGENELTMWNGTTDKGAPAAPGPIYVVAEFTTGGKREIVRKNGILWR